MRVFKRLNIILSDQELNNALYKEEYWALRKRYNIKDGHSLDPLPEDQKKIFREEVKKLKNKYNIKKNY